MSSHREAPEISKDPVADSTDVYAFVSPDKPGTVTLIANYIPLQEPAGGPNFYEFGDDVLYAIHIDNTGNGQADISYQFRFRTEVLDENTFLPVTREVRAVVEGAWTPASSVPQPSGIVAGQYHAPIGEYLFQEGLPGVAPPAIPFGTLPFLARGGYSSATGVVATGPLNPWPGSGGAL